MESPEKTSVVFGRIMPENSQPLSDARKPIVACLIEIARWGQLYWSESITADIDTLERWAQGDADADDSAAKDAATRLLPTHRDGDLSCAAGHVASVVLADELDINHCKMLSSVLKAYHVHSPWATRDSVDRTQDSILATIKKHFPRARVHDRYVVSSLGHSGKARILDAETKEDVYVSDDWGHAYDVAEKMNARS